MVTITSGFERWRADVASKDARGNTAIQVLLGYNPFPKQGDFHRSRAKYRLFGGAAGPGKSKALLMEAVVQANEFAGANTLLLRRTFPELEQSLLHYFRRDVPRELYKNFQESKHLVTWRNDSTTRFGYCQNESDVYQYQGAEFLFIGIDELTLFTLRQWQFLTSRNRCPVPGAFPCMAGATNPGNIGHAWVKSLWIDKQAPAGMENPAEYDPADYEFIPARVSDNPIYAGDENYLKTLRALPSHLRRAFLDGDWDVFAGQYFDRFDYSRHVLRAEEIDWKPWWPRWISIDWGFEHPAAAYWHTAVPGAALVRVNDEHAFAGGVFPDKGEASPSSVAGHGMDSAGSPQVPCPYEEKATVQQKIPRRPQAGLAPLLRQGGRDDNATCGIEQKIPRRPDGALRASGLLRDDDPRRIVTYREYVTHRTSPRELAREIIGRSLTSGVHSEDGRGYGSAGGEREKIDAVYLSPDAFAQRTDEASIADQMGDVFVAAGFPRPVPADNDRVGGWMLMYQMLEAGEWVLTENCIELIRTLPNLVRDSARIEDIEKMDGDDPADAARYGLKSRYGVHRGGSERRMPLADRLASRVVSADPTIRAIQARKAQLEETRGTQPVPFPRRRR